MRMRECDRGPVSTYPEALLWLLQHAQPEDWLWDARAELPLAARLVCDLFWVNQSKLIADMCKEWNTLMGIGRPRRHAFKGVPV